MGVFVWMSPLCQTTQNTFFDLKAPAAVTHFVRHFVRVREIENLEDVQVKSTECVLAGRKQQVQAFLSLSWLVSHVDVCWDLKIFCTSTALVLECIDSCCLLSDSESCWMFCFYGLKNKSFRPSVQPWLCFPQFFVLFLNYKEHEAGQRDILRSMAWLSLGELAQQTLKF